MAAAFLFDFCDNEYYAYLVEVYLWEDFVHMKKLISLALAALLVLTTLPALAADPAADTSWYGDGSASEFTISSAAELLGLASLVNNGNSFAGKVIRLGADIDLSAISSWTPIGIDIKEFRGEFDGQGHTISGLKCTTPNNRYMGLFGHICGVYVHSFTLSGAQISYTGSESKLYCGTVAAYVENSVFKDITVTQPVIIIAPTGGGVDGIIVGGAFGRFSNSQAESVNVNSLSIEASCSKAGGEKYIAGHTGMTEDGTVGENGKFSEVSSYSSNAHWLPGTTFEDGKPILNLFRSCKVTGSEAALATITAEGYSLNVGGFLGSERSGTYHAGSDLFSNCTVSGLNMTCTGMTDSDGGNAAVRAGGFAGRINSSNAVSSGSVIINGFEGCSASGTMTINHVKKIGESTGNVAGNYNTASGFGGFVGVSTNQIGRPSYHGADASGMTINTSADIKYTDDESNPNKRIGSFVGNSSNSTYTNCKGANTVPTGVGFHGAGASGLNITPALLDLGTHGVQSYSGATGTFTLENIGTTGCSLEIPVDTDHFNISWNATPTPEGSAGIRAVTSLTREVTIAPRSSLTLTVTPKAGLGIGKYTDTIQIREKPTGNNSVGKLLGTVAATIEIIAPAAPTSGGIDLWYNGGNSFGSSKSAVPTSVEIDGQPVGFVGDGGEFSVSCLQPGARWITVKWHSTTVTTSFTPDMNAHCDTVAIPKTGDMPLFASILAWLGL